MTFVGHSLVGVSAAVLAMPSHMSVWRWVVAINVFVLLSYLPDLPFPFWGHSRYAISHSLYVNLFLMTACYIIRLSFKSVHRLLPARLFFTGIAVWGSHLLLDALYKGPGGVAIFWPFSRAVLNLPVPWFDYFVPSLGVLHMHNLNVFGIEAMAYLPILFMAFVVRRIWIRVR